MVEDNDDLRAMLAALLETLDAEIVTAENGLAALNAVKRRRPDVILLDMKMPVMDGWTFVHELDRSGIHRPPIVVLTAAARPAERAADIGAEAWLPKPFDPDELLLLIGNLAHRSPLVSG